MSKVASSFRTSKGTELPLMNLRGKPYLQVAHRLVWLTEEHSNYDISTTFLELNEEFAIAQSNVVIFDESGRVLKRATATKKETKKDFPDFIEKAETGSLGRALAMLGLGTQFCEQDLDEGDRLADSPTVPKKTVESKAPAKASSFSKKTKVEENNDEQGAEDGWQ